MSPCGQSVEGPVDNFGSDLSIDLSAPPVGNPPTGQNPRSDHLSAPDMSETLRQVENRRSEGYPHLSETLPPTGVVAGAPAHPPRRVDMFGAQPEENR